MRFYLVSDFLRFFQGKIILNLEFFYFFFFSRRYKHNVRLVLKFHEPHPHLPQHLKFYKHIQYNVILSIRTHIFMYASFYLGLYIYLSNLT